MVFDDVLNKSYDRRTPEIVRDLVLSRYEDSYPNLINKLRTFRFPTKIMTNDPNYHGNYEQDILDTKNDFYKKFQHQPLMKVNINQSGMKNQQKMIHDIPHSSPLNSISSQSNDSDYNERKFLRNAIGEELLRRLPTAQENHSIGTDEVSALISATSTLIDQSSYYSYENITDLAIFDVNVQKKEMKNDIYVNEKISEQIEKLLKLVKDDFLGTPVHLEAERILLLSQLRRNILLNHLYKIPDPTSTTTACVTIGNLECILNMEDLHPLDRYHYICIIQHKANVLSTRIATPNRLGRVDWGGLFIFENISNTFSIKMQLYVLHIARKSVACTGINFLKRPKLPLMELAGEATIGIGDVRKRKFTLHSAKSKELVASFNVTLNWPATYKGFLTIGMGKMNQQPLWNRRWCVLQNTKLVYYNYPSDEEFGVIVGVIDLQHCKLCDDDGHRFLKQKTMRLLVDTSEDFRRIYICPDTSEEYDVWNNNIKLIMNLIKEWQVLQRN